MATHGFGYNHQWYNSHVQPQDENSFSDGESICTPSSDASSQLFPEASSYPVEHSTCLNGNIPGHFSGEYPEQSDSEVRCVFCAQEGVATEDCCKPPLFPKKKRTSKEAAAVHQQESDSVESSHRVSAQLTSVSDAKDVAPIKAANFQPSCESDNGSESVDTDVNNADVPRDSLSERPQHARKNVQKPCEKQVQNTTVSSDKGSGKRISSSVAANVSKAIGILGNVAAILGTDANPPPPLDWTGTPQRWTAVCELRNDRLRHPVAEMSGTPAVAPPMLNTTDGADKSKLRSRLCEICDCQVSVDQWNAHNKSDDHYANEEEALRNYETKWPDGTTSAAKGWNNSNDYYCAVHNYCGGQPCAACKRLDDGITNWQLSVVCTFCQQNIMIAEFESHMKARHPGKRLKQDQTQAKTAWDGGDPAGTTWSVCDHCGIQGCVGCKPPPVLTESVRHGMAHEPPSPPPISIVNGWPVSGPLHIHCDTCKRHIPVESWGSHVDGNRHRKKAENRKKHEEKTQRIQERKEKKTRRIQERKEMKMRRIQERKEKKLNDDPRSCGGWGCEAGCADGGVWHSSSEVASSASYMDLVQREALRGQHTWGYPKDEKSGRYDGGSWGGSCDTPESSKPKHEPKSKPVRKPTAPFTSTDSVSSKGVSEDSSWGTALAPSPSRLAVGNKPPERPARQDLAITYWITVESGDRKMHVPIEPEQVAGPEKDIVNGAMKKIWQWVQEKKIADKVSLQDAFELAQAMHGDTTKAGGGPDKNSGSDAHSNSEDLFQDANSPSECTGGAGKCAEKPPQQDQLSPLRHNRKTQKKQNYDNAGWSPWNSTDTGNSGAWAVGMGSY